MTMKNNSYIFQSRSTRQKSSLYRITNLLTKSYVFLYCKPTPPQRCHPEFFVGTHLIAIEKQSDKIFYVLAPPANHNSKNFSDPSRCILIYWYKMDPHDKLGMTPKRKNSFCTYKAISLESISP